jgi:SAM-dependent methyltransferase
MFLSRTRYKAKLALKEFVFDKSNLQEVIDVRRRNALEYSMGFGGQWDEHCRFQIGFLKNRGLLPTHKLLEIGCGPLTGGIPIIGYLDPGNYFGIDIRSSVLDLSWCEIGLAKLSAKNPRLICSASFGSEELGQEKFDFVFSFSVLFHLTDELLQSFLLQVSARLKPHGICLAQVNTHLEDSAWLQFPFIKRTVTDYLRAAQEAGLNAKPLGTIQSLGFKLESEERLNEMLEFSK